MPNSMFRFNYDEYIEEINSDVEYMVYCSSYEDYKKIITWNKSKDNGYSTQFGEVISYDVIIPNEYKQRVIKLLNLVEVGREDFEEV